MFATSSSRHGKSLLVCFKLFNMAAAGQSRRHDHETTVDWRSDARVGYRRTCNASRSVLGLVASVGSDPADSTFEGSPGRDRASSLAQHWMYCCVVRPLLATVSVISLRCSGSRGLYLFGDCPDEARQLARDRSSDHRRQLSDPCELAIPSAQPLLSFPCDVADRLDLPFLPQQLLSADPCRETGSSRRFRSACVAPLRCRPW